MEETTARNYTSKIEEFRAVVAMGQTAVRHQILINGGACVALLAFISSIFDNHEDLARRMALGLVVFGLGVLFGGMVAGFMWLGHKSFYEEKESEGKLRSQLGEACSLLSYIFFFLGGVIVTKVLLYPS